MIFVVESCVFESFCISFRISLRFGNYALLCRFVGISKLESEFGARLREDGQAWRKIQEEESRRRAKRSKIKKRSEETDPKLEPSMKKTTLRIDPKGVDPESGTHETHTKTHSITIKGSNTTKGVEIKAKDTNFNQYKRQILGLGLPQQQPYMLLTRIHNYHAI